MIYAVKNEEALKYIRDLVESSEAKPIELDREIVVVSQDDEFTYRYKDYELETIILNMLGEHQKKMQSLQLLVLIELYEQEIITLDFNKMIDAIESVSWTGRIEQVKENPLIIIDGAHNNESIEALIDTIKNYYDNEKWTFFSRR